MSEKIGTPSTEQLQSQWDSFSENGAWLQEQRDKAEAAGDEETLAKADDAIEVNNQTLQSIQQDMEAAQAADVAEDEIPTLSMEDAPQAEAHPYQRTVNVNGVIESISADTQEEFDEKLQALHDQIAENSQR
jgi:hypothetical protein